MNHNKHYRDHNKTLIARCIGCNTITLRSRMVKVFSAPQLRTCKRCDRDHERSDRDLQLSWQKYYDHLNLRDAQVDAWMNKERVPLRPSECAN